MDAEFGLIGEKLGHSYSKIIHERLGYGYDLVPLPPEEVAPFLSARMFSGLNVTIPYKKTVMESCDFVTSLARRIGAVNTLYMDHGKLVGTNTDYAGFKYMLEKTGIDPAGKKVLVLGTGGAAAMIKTALSDMGASDIIFASRSGPVTYDRLPRNAEIVINATPVGTYPDTDDAPADLTLFENLEGAIDLVYNPLRTKFIGQALALGVKATGGLPMLVAQATASADLFMNGKTDLRMTPYASETDQVLAWLESEIENIVLVGMPGSGKTSIGRILAQETGRVFVDTDDEIEKETGRSPSRIITEDGEDAFRDIESEIISSAAREHSRVIATGGGAVLREENIARLKRNGRIVFIQREPSKLATEDRPLSMDGKKIAALLEQRLPIYRAVCDLEIDNGASPEAAAGKILAETGLGTSL